MAMNKVLQKLPYRYGSEAWLRRFKEVGIKKEKPKEVNCFGTDKYEVRHGIIVKIFNEKLNIWQDEVGIEHLDICPVCGTFMLVRAINGTTYLPLCSGACFEKFEEMLGAERITEGNRA